MSLYLTGHTDEGGPWFPKVMQLHTQGFLPNQFPFINQHLTLSNTDSWQRVLK